MLKTRTIWYVYWVAGVVDRFRFPFPVPEVVGVVDRFRFPYPGVGAVDRFCFPYPGVGVVDRFRFPYLIPSRDAEAPQASDSRKMPRSILVRSQARLTP